MNKLRVRVLTLVVTAQRNHFLTFAGFTVKNKATSITPQTESVLLTGSSSTPVSATSSVFIFECMCFYIWFWVRSLVPDNDFQCSVAVDCDGCKRRILGLSWQQCGLPKPVESKYQRPDLTLDL